jgi:hypothetical protein
VRKKILQLLILFTVIILTFFFLKFYFIIDNEIVVKNKKNENTQIVNNENSIIQGLKYEINLSKNKQYIITSNLSKINYINNEEVVSMEQVTGLFIIDNNLPIEINSDNANYNNSTYNTIFKNNVKINYQDNVIKSDKMTLDFKENKIKISENIKYFNDYGLMTADEIEIDLITKEVLIYMIESKKKVKFISE